MSNSRRSPRLRQALAAPVAAALLGLLALLGPLNAQTPEAETTADPATDEQTSEEQSVEGDGLDDLFGEEAEATPASAEAESLDLIEDLLEEGDEVMESVFVYSGEGRRDPFRSLLVANQDLRATTAERPEGIPGLLIDEISLTGVWMYTDEPVAQVQSPDQPVSFLLRKGDRLFDGEVTDIRFTREEGGIVTFRQIVQDPTAPKPYRDVVRRLEP